MMTFADASCCYNFTLAISSSFLADFMAVPFIKPQKSILGFPRAAKDWLAGKIANNLISSRLEASQSDEESENESHASARCKLFNHSQ